MTPIEYTQQRRNLPDFLKDFHDQKDVFKTIQDLYGDHPSNDSLRKLPNSWADNHIYVIDFFLWFLGQHGWKLQRDRSNVEFYDIHATLKEFSERRSKKFAQILGMTPAKTENPEP